jgi:ribA/ribD-fused uncharacterized protein
MTSKITKAFSVLMKDVERLTNKGFLPEVDVAGSGYVVAFNGAYSPLSNFHTEPFDLNGVEVASAEHAYQASKCSSPTQRARVLKASTPASAKLLGKSVRRIEGFDRLRLALMYVLKKEQVRQLKSLRNALVRSAPKLLIEGNGWHDNYWGACHCAACSELPKRNMLGRIYHQIRDEIT